MGPGKQVSQSVSQQWGLVSKSVSRRWSVAEQLVGSVAKGEPQPSPPPRPQPRCVTERFLGSISKSELCSMGQRLTPCMQPPDCMRSACSLHAFMEPCAPVCAAGITISAQQPSDGAISWYDFATACTATRFAPLAPPAFEAMLRDGIAAEEAAAGTGITFTDSSDASTACVTQYTRAFLRHTISATELSYHACFWGHAEAKVLARSLQYMCQQGAAAEVTRLVLSRNQLNDAAIAPLLSALADGFLPKRTSPRFRVRMIAEDEGDG